MRHPWRLAIVGLLLLTPMIRVQAQEGSQSISGQAPGFQAGVYRTGVMRVDGIGVSAGVPGVILVAGGSGLLYSLDDGATWVIPVRPDHQAPAVRPSPLGAVAAIAPRDASAGGANVRFIVANTNRLWRSGDYGMTWTVETLALHPDCASYPDSARVQSIQVNPRTPTQLIVRMECIAGVQNIGGIPVPLIRRYILVSNDSGLTYALTGWSSFVDVVPSQAVSGRLFGLSKSGVWQQSDDYGATWATRNFPVTNLATDPQDAALLFGRNTNGSALLISADNGQTWGSPISVPPVYGQPCSFKEMMGSPAAGGTLFVRCAETDGWQRYSRASGQWLALSLPSTGTTTQGPGPVNLTVDHRAPGRLFFTHPTGLRQFDALGENVQLPETRFPAPLAAEWRIHLSSPWSWRNLVGADWTADGQVWATYPLAGPHSIVRWDGQAWTTSNPDTCDALDMVTPSLGFAGCGDSLRRWDGTNWVVDEPIMGVQRLSMITGTIGMAVGFRMSPDEQGIFARNASGWTLVRPITSVTPSELRWRVPDIDLLATDFGWVVENGRILRWDGAQFTESPTGVTPAPFINAISALDRDSAWAVGRDGVALRWNGTAWLPYYNVSPYNESLIDVVMVSPTEAWALAEGSNILHFRNGTWSLSAAPVLQASRLIVPPTGEQWALGDQPYERVSLIYLPSVGR